METFQGVPMERLVEVLSYRLSRSSMDVRRFLEETAEAMHDLTPVLTPDPAPPAPAKAPPPAVRKNAAKSK